MMPSDPSLPVPLFKCNRDKSPNVPPLTPDNTHHHLLGSSLIPDMYLLLRLNELNLKSALAHTQLFKVDFITEDIFRRRQRRLRRKCRGSLWCPASSGSAPASPLGDSPAWPGSCQPQTRHPDSENSPGQISGLSSSTEMYSRYQ